LSEGFLTLAAMGLTVAAGLVALAEITFVVGFTGIEVMQYTLRERITRMERRAHSLPERRYWADVSDPLITVVAGAAAGVGASTRGNVHENWFAPSLGWAILFFCFSANRAAGGPPRPGTPPPPPGPLADTARGQS